MYDNKTGLLTVAMHACGIGGSLPDEDQWERPAGIHVRFGRRARITVAGQWRSLTALPEHLVAEQVKWRGSSSVSLDRRTRARFQFEAG